MAAVVGQLGGQVDVGHPVRVGQRERGVPHAVAGPVDAAAGGRVLAGEHALHAHAVRPVRLLGELLDGLALVAGQQHEAAKALGRVDRTTCHTIGRPPISTSGLGSVCVCSCRPGAATAAEDQHIGRLAGASRQTLSSARITLRTRHISISSTRTILDSSALAPARRADPVCPRPWWSPAVARGPDEAGGDRPVKAVATTTQVADLARAVGGDQVSVTQVLRAQFGSPRLRAAPQRRPRHRGRRRGPSLRRRGGRMDGRPDRVERR